MFPLSSPVPSREYNRSAFFRSNCTAETSVLSAGPAAIWIGRIMSGYMGLVELGVRCGSHVDAGRSYHGTDASPCADGKLNGTSLASLKVSPGAVVPAVSATSPCKALRNSLAVESWKYLACSQRPMRPSSLRVCFGQLEKSAATEISLGIELATFSAKALLRLRTTVWWRTSLRMYRMCSRLRFELGFLGWMSAWHFDRAARNFARATVRAEELATWFEIKSLHFYFGEGRNSYHLVFAFHVFTRHQEKGNWCRCWSQTWTLGREQTVRQTSMAANSSSVSARLTE